METSWLSVGLLIQTALLAAALSAGHWLERKGVRWFGGAAAALGLGMLAGLLAKILGAREELSSILSFKGDFFIYVLLPPIMFEAGLSINYDMFMSHIGPICAFAIIGTATSAFVIGGTMWAAGALGLVHALSPLKALLFGSVVCVSDPVTVLAVFKKLRARDDLHTLVLGESVLNDAVGMVLFETVCDFLDGHYAFTMANVWIGVATFLVIFVVSTALGVGVGLGCTALMQGGFYRTPQSSAESGFILLAALLSFFSAQAFGLSGIVAIIFCGITMQRTTVPHLSPPSAQDFHSFLHVTANLAELFAFTYMGIKFFLTPQQWYSITGFVAVTLIAMALSRASSVYPISLACNLLRPEDKRIDTRSQFMLWWAGLRGGMAYALAVSAATKYGMDGQYMETAVFVVCLLTVVVNGGATPWLLQKMELLNNAGQGLVQPLLGNDAPA